MTIAGSPETTAKKPGRGKIYDSITETIGDTPLVRFDRLAAARGVKANLLGEARILQSDRLGEGPHRRGDDRRARSRRAGSRPAKPS